jgi:hydrophobe/amphiphile efflux-1 (HAE1) family protein
MRLSHFFIDRPIFAAVISIIVVILGGVSFSRLPVAQYPDIAPPTINVTGQYPGASADVVASTVVSPIEDQINGVEGMLYLSSNSTSDGRFSIAVTFDLGVNLDIAQVQVQNRVAIAQPRLPTDVRNIGVVVGKASPDLMMVVHLYSPDKSRDQLYVSNYASLEVKDAVTRVDGVGSITVFGSRDYSMRVWLDPGRLESLGLTSQDVVTALLGQNLQVASGVLNQPPEEQPLAFQVSVQTQGRLTDPAEFGNIVIKQTQAAVVRLKNIARVELAALDYGTNSYLDRDPAVALAIFQRPGSNALATAKTIRTLMADLSQRFPAGVKYAIVYDPTTFIQQSVEEVENTILIAVVLVVLVVILFLQTWRAAVIPIIAIPVSLIGTFFYMTLFGFSLNNLSLFGLVLAVGIVVDDAIVVVENVERNIAAGMKPREAAYKSMDEVGGALIAISLVLCAVFVPTAFITGISGQFYRQFALTIAGATSISLLVSLTLSPALCAILLRPHEERHGKGSMLTRPIRGFFNVFNRGFDAFSHGYSRLVARVVVIATVMLLAYAAVLTAGFFEFRAAPTGFIPQLDRGYIIVAAQLPPGASIDRTDKVLRRGVDIALDTPGVAGAVNFVGFSGATFTQASNSGAIFLVLDDFSKRRFPHDGGGSLRPRAAGLAGRGLCDDGQGGADAAGEPGVLAVRDLDAATLSRHRPHQGATPWHQHPRRVLGAANLSRLVLRQRLQPVRAHVPGDRAGRRPLSPRSFRRAEYPGAQPGGCDRSDRRLHDGKRQVRPVPGAALQPLSRGGARRSAGARGLAGPGDRHHAEDGGRDAARRLQLRMDHACLPAVARGQYRHLRIRAGGGLRLPGARRTI